MLCEHARAQPVVPVVENPPVAAGIARSGGPPTNISMMASLPTVPSIGCEASWWAKIVYTDAQIFNPRAEAFDNARPRYQRAGVDPACPFVAPTVSLIRGDTFRLTLNYLPADDSSCGEVQVNAAAGPQLWLLRGGHRVDGRTYRRGSSGINSIADLIGATSMPRGERRRLYNDLSGGYDVGS
jgi:hypothetical protein